MKHQFKIIFISNFFIAIGLIFFFSSCGKVSQEVGLDKAKEPSFNLDYSIDLRPSININLRASSSKTPTLDYFILEEQPFYSQIQGINFKEKALFSDLSYGKAVIFIKKNKIKAKNSTANTLATIYQVNSYDKFEVLRKNSDHTWITMSYNSAKNSLIFTANKLKKTYDYYIIKIYSNKNRFYLKIISQKDVTGNIKVSSGEISLYDTFISSIFLTYINAKDIKEKIDLTKLKELYNIKFFQLLRYNPPINIVKRFNYKEPIFSFSRKLEKELANIMELYIFDPYQALEHIEKLKKGLLPDKALAFLKSKLQEAL